MGRCDEPVRAEPSDALDLAMRLALIAPSPRNTQPWTFNCPTPDTVELRRDRNRGRPVCDPQHRELTISCGAALFYLRLALTSLGAPYTTQICPDESDSDTVARVEVTGRPCGPDAAAKQLVIASCVRRTTWGEFFEFPVPGADLEYLLGSVPDVFGVSVRVVEGELPAQIAAMAAAAQAEQETDPRFREELRHWPTGRPVSSSGDCEAATGTLLLLSTATDAIRDWIAAGQALAGLLLRATGLGLSSTFLNQPIQVPRYRTRLAELVGSDEVPQQIVRLGFSAGGADKTSRRELDDVLTRRPLIDLR